MSIECMKKVIPFVMILVVAISCKTGNEPKTIYVIRHAEKQMDSEDPELSLIGEERAEMLGQLMADKNIAHVYTTNTVRTKATVRHVADNQGVDVDIYDVRDQEELIDKLKSNPGNALVVGHSNTVHHVLNYFSESQEYQELAEGEYDFIFIINVDADGSSTVTRKFYNEF